MRDVLPPSTRATKVSRALLVLASLGAGALAHADTTSGGVNWLDSLGYTKPHFVPLTVPSEATATKYYVDMTNGSGSTCSQSAPCSSLNSVSGKTGTSGGPAVIYLKGNGYLNLTSSTLAGASGKEIVVKPWPNDSTPAVMKAQGGCTRTAANTIAGGNTHHVIFDGGPDMLIRFVGSGCTNDQNGYTLVVASNDITLYRVRIDAANSGGPALGPAVGSGTHQTNFRFINSEVYGAGRYYGVYAGGGTGCTAGDTSFTNLEFRNSIFRNIDGRGIQVEPRADSSGLIVDGNVFHDVGYNRSGAQSISDAVQPAAACGGTTDNVTISNNVSWDLGGGFVRVDYDLGSASRFRIINNTVWDYGNATPVSLASHAITAYSDGARAEVRNNILLAPANSGITAINRGSGFTTNDNVCESGMTCGSGAIASTAANTFASTTMSTSFLFPKGPALSSVLLILGFETDYLGKLRLATADAGAISASGTTAVQPNPPTALTVE